MLVLTLSKANEHTIIINKDLKIKIVDPTGNIRVAIEGNKEKYQVERAKPKAA